MVRWGVGELLWSGCGLVGEQWVLQLDLRWGGRLNEEVNDRRTEPSLFHSLSWGSDDREGPQTRDSPELQPPSESSSVWVDDPRHTARKIAQAARSRDRPSTTMMLMKLKQGPSFHAGSKRERGREGNSKGLFRINELSGLVMRGQRALDRESSSSHVLEVEAYNSDQGRMRSSVRVRRVGGVRKEERERGDREGGETGEGEGTGLEVEADNSDQGRIMSSVRGLCLPLQVIVYVEDANDEAPVFTQQQYNRLGLRETAGIGTSVIVVRATDPDTGDGGAVAYALDSGSDRKFDVDVSTGLVTTVDYLDYETKTSYLMNVSATDQAPPFHRGFCTVYVTLLNELDEAVAFFSAGYEVSLLENIATGTEVVQVQARSADNLNQLSYRFDPDTSPAALALFKIDSITGRITVTGLLDREKGDLYTLTVVADDGGPKKDSTVVSITIQDENDNSPEFDITSDSLVEIPENTPIGKRVAVVLGRDKDAGNNGLVKFSLVAGNMQDVFEIRTVNHTYGEIYVNFPLDRDAPPVTSVKSDNVNKGIFKTVSTREMVAVLSEKSRGLQEAMDLRWMWQARH
ncbi:unnamed protein product, partial [Coregonus sp. 'balchen']